MRFLFCPIASHGFVYPAIGIAQALRARGHDVAFVTSPAFAEILLQTEFEYISWDKQDSPTFQIQQWFQPQAVRDQVQHLEYALTQFSPDVLVGQPMSVGSIIVAERQQLPLAMLGLAAYLWPTSSALLTSAPTSETKRRLIWRYKDMLKHYNAVRQFLDLAPSETTPEDLPLLGDLFLLQSVPEFELYTDTLPPQVHLVGSCLWDPPQADPVLNAWLNEAKVMNMPVLYVQHGRFFELPGFWEQLVDVLRDQPICVVASLGRMDKPVGTIPRNFLVRRHISQGLVLPRAHGVVAGANTTAVLGALTHGVPSLFIYSGGEQPDLAERCIKAGVAICIAQDQVNAQTITQAIQGLLHDAALQSRVQTLQSAFTHIHGCERAATLMEALASTRKPVLRV